MGLLTSLWIVPAGEAYHVREVLDGESPTWTVVGEIRRSGPFRTWEFVTLKGASVDREFDTADLEKIASKIRELEAQSKIDRRIDASPITLRSLGTPTVFVTSASGNAAICLEPCEEKLYSVKLQHAGLEVTTTVCHASEDRFADFWAGLSSGMGNEGQLREWVAQEGTFGLRATADHFGNVELRVRLQQGSPHQWQVHARMLLRSSDIAAFADQARRFEAALRVGA